MNYKQAIDIIGNNKNQCPICNKVFKIGYDTIKCCNSNFYFCFTEGSNINYFYLIVRYTDYHIMSRIHKISDDDYVLYISQNKDLLYRKTNKEMNINKMISLCINQDKLIKLLSLV